MVNADREPLTVVINLLTDVGEETFTHTIPPRSRQGIPLHDYVKSGGRNVNFGVEVVFPVDRMAGLSLALWHRPDYGNDRFIYVGHDWGCR